MMKPPKNNGIVDFKRLENLFTSKIRKFLVENYKYFHYRLRKFEHTCYEIKAAHAVLIAAESFFHIDDVEGVV